jgi:uncharacterized phage protein (TIGR02216 family)
MIDWPAWIRFGVGALRLSPDVFWGLTPYELMCLAPPAKPPLDRDALTDLMTQYPDKDTHNHV